MIKAAPEHTKNVLTRVVVAAVEDNPMIKAAPVLGAIGVGEAAIAVGLVAGPLTLVAGTIRPDVGLVFRAVFGDIEIAFLVNGFCMNIHAGQQQ